MSELFKLQAPIIIKHKNSSSWENDKELEAGRLGAVTDLNYVVCGNGVDKTFVNEEERIVWDKTNGYFIVEGLPRISGFIIAPMFGYMYDSNGKQISKTVDGKTYNVEKRTGKDYKPVNGTLLYLYDNRDEFTKSTDVINPEYAE